jgi:hypothetical protein
MGNGSERLGVRFFGRAVRTLALREVRPDGDATAISGPIDRASIGLRSGFDRASIGAFVIESIEAAQERRGRKFGVFPGTVVLTGE